MTNGGEKSIKCVVRIGVVSASLALGSLELSRGSALSCELYGDANGIGGFVLIAMYSFIRIEMIRPVGGS